MLIFKSINKLVKYVNFKESVGFVPTMGALHAGHISLIKKSKVNCKKTLVSIFINPSQFNNLKDLTKYPKKLSNDIKILKKLKVDYLLLPKEKDIYPSKTSKYIKIAKIDKIMCAKFRPGHFEGVLGVINRFLLNINAKFMYLGEKDYQQLFLIKKFIKKKFFIKVINCKTLRDNYNLPYSSRNFLLSTDEIRIARDVSMSLKKLYLSLKKNPNQKYKVKLFLDKIKLQKLKVEYLEIRNKKNLSLKYNKQNLKIFIAYYINDIRLIDNI